MYAKSEPKEYCRTWPIARARAGGALDCARLNTLVIEARKLEYRVMRERIALCRTNFVPATANIFDTLFSVLATGPERRAASIFLATFLTGDFAEAMCLGRSALVLVAEEATLLLSGDFLATVFET